MINRKRGHGQNRSGIQWPDDTTTSLADGNVESPKIAYQIVDWNKLADALGMMEGTGEEMWVEMRKIVDALPRAGVARGKCTWWIEKLERMAKDVKCLRRR